MFKQLLTSRNVQKRRCTVNNTGKWSVTGFSFHSWEQISFEQIVLDATLHELLFKLKKLKNRKISPSTKCCNPIKKKRPTSFRENLSLISNNWDSRFSALYGLHVCSKYKLQLYRQKENIHFVSPETEKNCANFDSVSGNATDIDILGGQLMQPNTCTIPKDTELNPVIKKAFLWKPKSYSKSRNFIYQTK